MITKQEMLEKYEELIKTTAGVAEELADLKEKIDSLPEEKTGGWRVRRGETYHYIDSLGGVGKCTNIQDIADVFRYSCGNCFSSEEEAQQHIENLITKQKLKDLAFKLNGGKEVNPGIDTLDGFGYNFVDLYYLAYGYGSKDITIVKQLNLYQSPGVIYCTDKEFLRKAIDLIGEKPLEQYIKSGV
ncbi:MAG: hypothetical protein NC334_09530 [Bacteroides sp.]|nr:hypothetical protein [Bacteroides sp.]